MQPSLLSNGSSGRLMVMRVLVVRQPADQAPGQQSKPTHERGVQGQVDRETEPQVVSHDGDDEGDEDANDEAHPCTLLLPQANTLPHQSASAWITDQRPAHRMPRRNLSNINGKLSCARRSHAEIATICCIRVA